MKKIYWFTLILMLPIVVNAKALKVGENEYDTFSEAIVEANSSGKEIVVEENIDGQEINVAKGQNITINLQNYILSRDKGEIGIQDVISNSGILKIYGEEKSQIKGQISNKEADSYLELNIGSGNFDGLTGDITNSGTLVFKNGKYTFNSPYGIKSSKNSKITFDGGEFYSNCTGSFFQGSEDDIVTINGGKFYNKGLNYFTLGVNTQIIVNNGEFNSDEELGSLFTDAYSSTTGSVTINNVNINWKVTVFSVTNGVINANIYGGTLKTSKGLIFSNSASSNKQIVTIGKNDGTIENTPTLISNSWGIDLRENDELNFYDGTITGKFNPPINSIDRIDFHTLDTYNVKDNLDGTYTARLIKDPESSTGTPNVSKDTDKTIENPKTGFIDISLTIIILISLILGMYLLSNKKDKINRI